MTGVRDRARVLSDGDRNEIAALRADGWTHAHIAAHFGVGIFVVRRVLDPAALRASERASRRRAAAGRGRGESDAYSSVDQDARTKAIQPPKRDERDLTAKVCGDPLPGRSALDRRGER